ncbi:hypothetical protein J6590_094448 [Homalodisca vitripennis]|nr:hypothetical protein J6590_076139 [Homalodisca vitripennis]KAG8329117.1 hypothetical protein J6590_094448 [Homalodisca vitripennis]
MALFIPSETRRRGIEACNHYITRAFSSFSTAYDSLNRDCTLRRRRVMAAATSAPKLDNTARVVNKVLEPSPIQELTVEEEIELYAHQYLTEPKTSTSNVSALDPFQLIRTSCKSLPRSLATGSSFHRYQDPIKSMESSKVLLTSETNTTF